MEGGNSNSENGDIGPQVKPEHGFDFLNITVSRGPDQHHVSVPSNSTFGDLKSVIAHKTGLNPETYKLLFRGKEKEDDDHLEAAGVKGGSKVLIMEEEPMPEEEIPEKVEAIVVSRGGEAVAIVREEVDKLADQVAALQAVVDGGTKVDDKDFLFLSEMLMRQLLKLDSIEAEGEGKVQRKMEVRRVQSFVDLVDILKSRNANHDDSNSNSQNNGAASVTIQCETSTGGSENVSTKSTEPSSTATFQSPEPSQSLLGREAVEAATAVPPKL